MRPSASARHIAAAWPAGIEYYISEIYILVVYMYHYQPDRVSIGISATVAVCCINKIDTVLARRIDDPARRPIVACTAEHHGAETDRRYPEPAVAELPILHLSLRKFLSIGRSDSIRAASALQSCGLAHP